MSNLITTEEISRLIYDRVASSPDSNLNISCIIHSNPQLIFIKLINASLDLSSSSLFSSKSSLLEMPESTLVGRNVVIGSNVVFGNNITIYPNVTIYDDCVIGDNVVIHSGAVIGSDGFGLVKDEDKWIKASYSLKGVGQKGYRDILAKTEKAFYFAGEHTAINYASMNGAIESGIRVSNEIKMT